MSMLKSFFEISDWFPSIRGKVVIFELKIAGTGRELSARCNEALLQIKENKYAEDFFNEGYDEIIEYSIAFYKKACMIKKGGTVRD